MELENEILKLKGELKRLCEKADEINLNINNVLEEMMTCLDANNNNEDANRQEFKLLFTKSIGKFIKISHEYLVCMGDDGNWEKAEEFYIGVVKDFRLVEYVICDVARVIPGEVVDPHGSYIINALWIGFYA